MSAIALPPAPASDLPSLTISVSRIVGVLVWLAMASSCVVFTEPAPVDMLLIGTVATMLVLGRSRPGRLTLLVLALWGVHVACALLAAMIASNPESALSHSLITLYLAIAGAVLAGWIAGDPRPRLELVMNAYVIAALVASSAAIIGYFGLIPGAHELFTGYGRGRGTFKDPNVFGAAILPALVYLAWRLQHAPWRPAAIALACALPILFGLLLSFSRGAWISAAVSLGWIGVFTIAGARSPARQLRLLWVAGAVGVGCSFLLGAALELEGLDNLFAERASLAQSYDVGPEGRFGGHGKAIGLIAENPLGIGTHAFRERHHHEEVHNVYLSLLLNAGWIGGLAYLMLVGATLWAGVHRCCEPGPLQVPQIVATAAFLGVAIEGLVIDTDHWRHFFIVQACVLGLAHGAPGPAGGVTAPSGRGRRAARLRAG
jgi:O-antigen ligase